MCVSFYYLPDSQRSRYSCLIWNFYGSVPTTKSMNGVYKTNIDCSFIRRMVENNCTLGKIKPQPTIHLGPTGLGEYQAKAEFHLWGNNFPPFPHEQSIFV